MALFYEGIDHVVALLRDMGKFPFADEDSMQCAIVEIEAVRCDMNADFTEHLADSERFDEGHFWKQRRAFEKKARPRRCVHRLCAVKWPAPLQSVIERGPVNRSEKHCRGDMKAVT